MSQTGNIIVFSGSLRDHSINVMLAKSVVNELESEGVSSTFLDLRNFDIPLYNGDSEDRNGLPKDLCLIHEQISTARGFIVTSRIQRFLYAITQESSRLAFTTCS